MSKITKSQLLDARDKLLVVEEAVSLTVLKKYLNQVVSLLDDLRLNEARPE